MRQRVRRHVPGIGEEGEAAREDAADHLHHHEAADDGEGDGEAARVAARVVVVMAVPAVMGVRRRMVVPPRLCSGGGAHGLHPAMPAVGTMRDQPSAPWTVSAASRT